MVLESAIKSCYVQKNNYDFISVAEVYVVIYDLIFIKLLREDLHSDIVH